MSSSDRITARFLAIAIAGLIAGSQAAAAWEPTPVGLWDRDDGLGGIRIAPCGDALCGKIVWLRDKDGPARLGQRVFYDMRRNDSGSWSGSALNPEDGRIYAGTLSLDGTRMVTRGCAFGGMVCQSVGLTRTR